MKIIWLFVFICSLKAFSSDENLNRICHLMSSNDNAPPAQIVSVFSLAKLIFIQIRSHGQNKTEMWRASVTKISFPHHPQRFTDYYTVHYPPNMDETEFFSQIKSTKISNTMRVSGHVLSPPTYLMEECSAVLRPDFNSSNPPPDLPPHCLELVKNHTSIFEFVCLYGYNTETTDTGEVIETIAEFGAIQYDSQFGTFFDLPDGTNKSEFKERCYPKREKDIVDINFTKRNPTSFLQYDRGTLFPYFYFTDVKLLPKNVNESLILSKLLIKSKPYIAIESVNASQVGHLFRYNEDLVMVACPPDCKFTSNMVNISVSLTNKGEADQKIETNSLGKKFHHLLGCAENSKPKFDPNNFCNAAKGFLSAITIGKDIYFQKRGLFYHYLDNGFNRSAVNNMHNISPIFVDSDFTQLLKNEFFELDLPVFGFAFKPPRTDLCYNNHRYDEYDCGKPILESNQYFWVCVLGHKTDPSDPDNSTVWDTFVHTPQGLRKFFDADASANAYRICLDVVEITIMKISYTEGQLQFEKKYSLNDEIIAYSSTIENGVNTVYSLSKDILKDNHQTYRFRQIQWNFNNYKLIDFLKHETRYELYASVNQTPPIIGNDHYEHITWFAYFQDMLIANDKNLDLVFDVEIEEIDESITIDNNIITTLNIFPRPIASTSKLFGCPFNQSSSLITSTNRLKTYSVCTNVLKKKYRDSVFTVGETLYHKVGQYFYKYDHYIREFLYDKYLTNLLNHYFDTRKHLTGYSICSMSNCYLNSSYPQTNVRNYYVIFHGRSNTGHRALGQYIYAAFKLKLNWMITLEAINNPSDEGFNDFHTSLGVQCSSVALNLMDAYGAFVYKAGKSQLVFADRKVSNDQPEEQIYFYISNIWTNVVFQFRKSCEHMSEYTLKVYDTSKLGFDRIAGIYSDFSFKSASKGLLYLVARSTNNKGALKIYPISRIDYKSDIKFIENLKPIKEYGEEFCKKPFAPRQSAKSTVVTNILAVCLIVLLILSLLIAAFVLHLKEVKSKRNISEEID